MRLTPILALLLMSTGLPAAPSSDLWAVWTANDPESRQQIDHSIWQGLLNRYVINAADGIARVDYANVSSDDRAQLKHYLSTLRTVSISGFSRPQQMAYWINLYNALTVDVVLDHYPVDSIRDIKLSGLFSSGPWNKSLLEIEGREVSLNDIEHRILRPIWSDARIHYALNCASLGCPNLQNEAFTEDNIDALLEKAATEFINHPRAVRIDDDELIVSSIYDWFIEDFGDSEASVIQHLKHYAREDLKLTLSRFDEFVDDYDWSLNALADE